MSTVTGQGRVVPVGVTHAGDVLGRVRARAAAGSGGAHAPVGDAWTEVREHQARVRGAAWVRDLGEQCLDAHARFGLADVERVHAVKLDAYVRGLVPGGERRVLNLILAGSVGSGKTTAAVAAGALAVGLGLSVRVVSHQGYLAMLRPDGAPQGLTTGGVRRRYRDVDLLIVDDLCAGMRPDMAAREFVEAESVSLFGDRLGAGRATIVTTNETSDTVNTVLGERTLSRIAAAGYVLPFTTEDRRGPVTW